ncbi:MAG: hypothetical protein KKF50_02500 [Nanoarchaeota archaeon]|nr:hypothetical protein [Nanoarchaeota archaeon]
MNEYEALFFAELSIGAVAFVGSNIYSYCITKSNLNEFGRGKIADHKKWVGGVRFITPIYLLFYGIGSQIAFGQYDRKQKKSIEGVVEEE